MIIENDDQYKIAIYVQKCQPINELSIIEQFEHLGVDNVKEHIEYLYKYRVLDLYEKRTGNEYIYMIHDMYGKYLIDDWKQYIRAQHRLTANEWRSWIAIVLSALALWCSLFYKG